MFNSSLSKNFICDYVKMQMSFNLLYTLYIDLAIGVKYIMYFQLVATDKTFNQKFQNLFCGYGELYNLYEEKITMF